jgi:hypothetical protein
MSTPTKKTRKPNPMQSKSGYTLIIVPKANDPRAHVARSLDLRDALKRNGHNFKHLLGRDDKGNEKRMFAVAFDPATKRKIDKIPAAHRRGVIHVDAKGAAVHAATGKKVGKVHKVTAAAAAKQHSIQDKEGSHFVIR